MKTAQRRRGAHGGAESTCLSEPREGGVVQARWETDTWQVDRGWMVQGQMKGLDLILWALEATGRYQMEMVRPNLFFRRILQLQRPA